MADIYPLFYFAGRRGIKGDAEWIHAGMDKIPRAHQQEVADEYERIYRNSRLSQTSIEWNERHKSPREAANRYLSHMVKELNKPKPRSFDRTFFDDILGARNEKA